VLRKLTGVTAPERLDGEAICRDIAGVIESIEAQTAGRELKLVAAFRLDMRSPLTQAIRMASQNEIETNDTKAQTDFVTDDLAGEPYLALVKDGGPEGFKVALLGAQITYWLSPYRVAGTTDVPSFEFAVCEKAELMRPALSSLIGFEVLRPESFDILPIGQPQEDSFARRRGRVANWQPRIDALKSVESRKTELDRKHEAFALLTVLEMAYAVADIFPVTVRPNPAAPAGAAVENGSRVASVGNAGEGRIR
jgi:hypothetical protein